MRYVNRSVVIALFCLLVALPVAAQASPPVVLFDQGHGQRFLPESSDALGLSRLAELFRAQGCEIRTIQEPLTPSNLAGVDAVVISGPFRPLTRDEIDALVGFVQQGGRLSVMLHIASPLSALLERFGVLHANGVIREEGAAVINDEPLNFRVTRLHQDPLLEGLGHFALYGGWALTTIKDSARIVAATSDRAWVDLNNNRTLDQGDAVQSFGVLVVGATGAGTFIAFGDDAIFQNRYLVGENTRLAANLVRRLIP